MEKEKISDHLDQLASPTVSSETHQKYFRAYLLNTHQSAIGGLILLTTPLLFMIGGLVPHYLGVDLGIITSFSNWIADLDSVPVLKYLVRTLLIAGPPLAVGVNLISLVHGSYHRKNRELLIGIRLRWLNLAIIAICLLVSSIFFFYLLIENLHHP